MFQITTLTVIQFSNLGSNEPDTESGVWSISVGTLSRTHTKMILKLICDLNMRISGFLLTKCKGCRLQ